MFHMSFSNVPAFLNMQYAMHGWWRIFDSTGSDTRSQQRPQPRPMYAPANGNVAMRRKGDGFIFIIVCYDVGYYYLLHRFYKSFHNVSLIGGKLLLPNWWRLLNRNCRSGKQ